MEITQKLALAIIYSCKSSNLLNYHPISFYDLSCSTAWSVGSLKYLRDFLLYFGDLIVDITFSEEQIDSGLYEIYV